MDDRKRRILRGFLGGLKAIFDDESDEITVDFDAGAPSTVELMGVENPVGRSIAKKRKVLLGAWVAGQIHTRDVCRDYDPLEVVKFPSESQDDEDENPQQSGNEQAADEQCQLPLAYEHLTSSLGDWDFKANYHLNRSTVEWLIDKLATGFIRRTTGRPPAPVHMTILLALWALANPEPFRSITERFGVGVGHAYRAFNTFCKLLHQLQDEYIIWPDNVAARRLAEPGGDCDFPDVIGCVDTTRINIRTPKDAELYRIDRKHHASIVLQAVCDTNLRFTNVFVGSPGSNTDSWVWRQSPLSQQLNDNPASLIPGDMHLLGDTSFPLRSYLMTPYTDRCPCDAKRIFNEKLNSKRAVIVRAFGGLRGRFQRLKYVNVLHTELVSVVVTAACVLHNICIELNDECSEVCMEVDDNYGSEAEDDFGGICAEACQKRDRLCALIADT